MVSVPALTRLRIDKPRVRLVRYELLKAQLAIDPDRTTVQLMVVRGGAPSCLQ